MYSAPKRDPVLPDTGLPPHDPRFDDQQAVKLMSTATVGKEAVGIVTIGQRD